jgi:nicotinamide mononucleotide adenylyltransferase
MRKYSDLIFEAANKTKLDISIQAAGKYLTSNKRIEEFFNASVIVEHKTDGVKITAMKIQSTGTLDDWIIAYKGNILYEGEFEFAPVSNVKKKSIGASQFSFVVEHFKNIATTAKKIPVGTELFVEFLMNKPTLSSDYTRKHGMILIAHTKSSYKVKNGLLLTKPGIFDISHRDEYAKMANLDVPALLFKGRMGTLKDFENGILNSKLKGLFSERSNAMNWNTVEILLDDVRELFLDVESKYGGKEEGVVIKYNDVILKFQQEYQLDQEARRQIKLKYQDENPEVETQYWNNVRLAAMEITNEIQVKPKSELKDLVKELSQGLKSHKLNFKHPKKDKTNIEDDIQLTAKQILMRKLKGNDNALIVGRFQPLTKGHVKMIKTAYKERDDVYINIVKGKKADTNKNPFGLEIQEKMLKAVFPKINIISGTTGNLITMFNKINDNINWVYCGTDRVGSYKSQLKKMPDVKIREIERTDEDISATKVRESLISNNQKEFEKLVPKEIHNMFEELRNLIN